MIKALFDDPSGQLAQTNTTSNYPSAHASATHKNQIRDGFTPEQENHIKTLNNELFTLRNELSQLKVNNYLVFFINVIFYF